VLAAPWRLERFGAVSPLQPTRERPCAEGLLTRRSWRDAAPRLPPTAFRPDPSRRGRSQSIVSQSRTVALHLIGYLRRGASAEPEERATDPDGGRRRDRMASRRRLRLGDERLCDRGGE